MSALQKWLQRDSYSAVAWLLFLITAAMNWRGYVGKHEAIYLLGSRRVAFPDLMAGDLSWGRLSPTTFLYDHLLAPLWGGLDDFQIVVIVRIVVWALLAWSLALLARSLKLPPWSVVVGFTLWLLARQSIVSCGSLAEGVQPKSFAYPLVFFALVFAIRGQTVLAGAAAGLATAFHIVIGGWGCLAIFICLVLQRKELSYRALALFLVASAPFILPLLVAVAAFHFGDLSAQEGAAMDQIYVRFASPHCCDPSFFMSTDRWIRILTVFPAAALLLYLWTEKRPARIAAWFLIVHIAVFWLGMLAALFDGYGLLKLFPFQWASGIAPLFLFILCLAYLAERPQRTVAQISWLAGLLIAGWLTVNREVFTERLPDVARRLTERGERPEPGDHGRYGRGISSAREGLYEWIRENTDTDSVFVTPYMPEFWTYSERSQVASFRHPPQDKRLIEWKHRLEELNGSEQFEERGFDIEDELDDNQRELTLAQLVRMRENFGATHYVVRRSRRDLASHLLFTSGRYRLYDLSQL